MPYALKAWFLIGAFLLSAPTRADDQEIGRLISSMRKSGLAEYLHVPVWKKNADSLRPFGKAATQELLRCLDRPDAVVASGCAWSLGHLQLKTPETIKGLAKMARTGNGKFAQEKALDALAVMEAREAAADIVAVVKNKQAHWRVRGVALDVLGSLKVMDAAATDAALASLDDPSEWVRRSSFSVIGTVASNPHVLEKLRQRYPNEPSPELRHLILRIIVMQAPTEPGTTTLVIRSIYNGPTDERGRAIDLTERLDYRKDPLRRELLAILGNPREVLYLRQQALNVLRRDLPVPADVSNVLAAVLAEKPQLNFDTEDPWRTFRNEVSEAYHHKTVAAAGAAAKLPFVLPQQAPERRKPRIDPYFGDWGGAIVSGDGVGAEYNAGFTLAGLENVPCSSFVSRRGSGVSVLHWLCALAVGKPNFKDDATFVELRSMFILGGYGHGLFIAGGPLLGWGPRFRDGERVGSQSTFGLILPFAVPPAFFVRKVKEAGRESYAEVGVMINVPLLAWLHLR